MIYSIFSSYDSTLYESSSLYTMNTGLDEILELTKTVNPNLSQSFNSRPILKFDLSNISQSIVDGRITDPRYYLSMYSTNEDLEIPADYTIYAYPVSSSWTRGTGRRFNKPQTTDGASWRYRTGVSAATWWATSSYNINSTGSWSTNEGGGNWYTSSAASQSYTFQAADARMDVTEIVKSWMSGSIENNGFIIKRSDADEQNMITMGNLQFFSTQTHTVYMPRLEVAWDDTTFSTGTLSAQTAEDLTLYFKNLNESYKRPSRAKIRVFGRERYPKKTFTTSSDYLTVKYLPTSSYYSIRDAYTEEIIVPFDDDYTKLSCDGNGNYFEYWMNGLHTERYYRFLIKIKRGENNIEIFDQDYIFKVVR